MFAKIFLVFISIFCCFNANSQVVAFKELDDKFKTIVLSKTNREYKAIEDYQRFYCERSAISCSISPGLCIVNIFSKLKNEINLSLAPENLNFIKNICVHRGTDFESPGIHYFLTRQMEVVEGIARMNGCSLKPTPLISTLPLQELNSSTHLFSTPVIFINTNFITSAINLSQLAALSVPVHVDDFKKNITISDDEALFRKIARDSIPLKDALFYNMEQISTGPTKNPRVYNGNFFVDEVVKNIMMKYYSLR